MGGYVNVKEMGAVGNGGVDDTAAIQKAFDTGKPVYFPAGAYRITDTITMYAPWIRGDGMNLSTIAQSTKDKDIFHVKFAWRGNISGIGLRGGAKQLNMRNHRVDQGLMQVRNCSFNESSDIAIYMEDESNPMHLVVAGCHFQGCEQVLYTVCDQTTLSECWITTAWMNNKAAIVNKSGKMTCENILGVPLVTGKDDRWIDNYSTLSCRGFRFGGEFGGMTPVYNFAALSKDMAGLSVVLDDCWISAQGSGRKCAIYLEEIPNLLTIRNCQLTVPAVMFGPKAGDLMNYFAHARPGVLQFDLQHNSGEYSDDPAAQALLKAARDRDTSPEPIEGQLSAEDTQAMLAKVVTIIKALPPQPRTPAVAGEHKQKVDSKDYIELSPRNAKWDCDDHMDATTIRNSQYIAMAEVGDDVVFMHRTPQGRWPHVLIRHVEIDLDRTPWISWKQKDPGGPDSRPAGVPERAADQKLDAGVVMPSGFAIKIIDDETKRMVMLFESHQSPCFEYGAKDIRKLFDLKGGKRTFTIKYFPLGLHSTGRAGSGYALAGEYQILDFIRLEAE
ncbi:MAG: hypothetical protein IT440_11850 [Phycisphaeraceae bacterium]|nr:hypothetical protein [Phycisphaeraceae bacterium]